MEIKKIKVLFVCVHNAGRSQMAEAFLKHYGGELFDAESAGLEPGNLNPLVVEAMKEEGIDISSNKSKRVFDLVKAGKLFNYVIAVCDQANAQRCPVFPGLTNRLQWSFEDPASVTGDHQEKLSKVREIRDKIKSMILEFIKTAA